MELRDLPSVTELISELEPDGWARAVNTEVARHALDQARGQIQEGGSPDAVDIARQELARVGRTRPGSMINASGVLLNTNLGRAPLHPEAASAAAEALSGYGNVEFDRDSGRRGGRGSYVHDLITTLTGGEAALVVNNNAGALFLALAALATDRQVVISRGELIEIGGSFRLPELMGAAGVWLLEVGTTNRTRLGDYRQAVGAETAMILKVHPSNYRTVGFTEEATYADLAQLAHQHELPFVADIGSGLLDAEVPWLDGPPPAWLEGEPAARQTLAEGADLVLFSGDKLLGGPQAGIIAGRRQLVDRLSRHPVARGLRCDGSTLAALAHTLELYADNRGAEVPFWAMASLPVAELEQRSKACLDGSGIDGEVANNQSVVGAGSVPGQTIPSPVIRLSGIDTDSAWRALLTDEPAVLARRKDGDLIVDLRAVPPDQDEAVAAALARACRS
ncbi:MAG: L-seryl-tRNA(Sec) selenium transferase [Acidimicrobiia bacterium]|nr:L-seryl-tRNA(Sec) selenium transferase [Acidimicrobiia bacterium]